MIDQLESAPKPPPLHKSSAEKIESEADTNPEFILKEEMVPVATAVAPSEPPSLQKNDFMIARTPNITINRRVSKLDEMEVQIRKPGELR